MFLGMILAMTSNSSSSVELTLSHMDSISSTLEEEFDIIPNIIPNNIKKWNLTTDFDFFEMAIL
jgi:hypothetical protein